MTHNPSAGGAAKEIIHLLTEKDESTMALVRAQMARLKGTMQGPEARGPFDDSMRKTARREGIRYEAAKVGGVPGIWCRPPRSRADAAILYLHGGAYVMGSAKGYESFAGQFAARTGTALFIPDYRLAPEHVFPAAVEDALSAYRALAANGFDSIAIVGDCAGAGLELVLISMLCTDPRDRDNRPVAAVAMSPWTDLSVTGQSIESRAAADPWVTKEMLLTTAKAYLGSHDPRDPRASALYAEVAGLPPLQIHVGADEVLLDDSLRYARRARTENVAVLVHVWEGMPHVFAASIGVLEAAEAAMRIMAAFLDAQFEAHLAKA